LPRASASRRDVESEVGAEGYAFAARFTASMISG
jgi:hypothetical protein